MHTAVLIYQGLIEPHFDYCSAAWNGLSQHLKSDKLHKLPHRAVRVITISSCDTSSRQLLDLLGWDNLSIRNAKQLRLTWLSVLTILPRLISGICLLRESRITNFVTPKVNCYSRNQELTTLSVALVTVVLTYGTIFKQFYDEILIIQGNESTVVTESICRISRFETRLSADPPPSFALNRFRMPSFPFTFEPGAHVQALSIRGQHAPNEIQFFFVKKFFISYLRQDLWQDFLELREVPFLPLYLTKMKKRNFYLYLNLDSNLLFNIISNRWQTGHLSVMPL